MENNSIPIRLKGEGIISFVPINLDLKNINKVIGYRKDGDNAFIEDDGVFKKVKIHLKNGLILSFEQWYKDETEFIDEPTLGFSGSSDIILKIMFLKESFL